MPSANSPLSKGQEIPTVSQLTADIKELLTTRFARVWVRGEIADLTRAASGHVYFSLKDAAARLSCVVWQSTARRINTPFKDGQDIICQGALDVYPPRGSYQLVVSNLVPVGVGPLQLAFQELHAKMKAQGWLDPARKRPLPPYPRRVGLVTSSEGAAVRDFLEVLGRRWPQAEVLLAPTRVQGPGAAEEIARAIRLVNRLQPPVDVLAVCRGGGSAEDLWSFNEEIVCRAIVESQVPVITGIGHEIDVTLSDMCADVRALTPTEAAERLAPHRGDLLAHLRETHQRLNVWIGQRITKARLQLDAIASRASISKPLAGLRESSMRLDELNLRLRHAMGKQLEKAQQACQQQAARLQSLNPLNVLARGYSITTSARRDVITDADQVAANDMITSRLARGKIHSRVVATEPDSNERPS